MPAKKQIFKEDIKKAAIKIVRREGMERLNSLTLTRELKCSTQPIYSSYRNIGALKEEVAEDIRKIYEKYLSDEVARGKYPSYKCYGMGYIRFAREEKNFFRYLFLRDRSTENKDADKGSLQEIIKIIMKNTGLAEKQAYLFHIEMWIYVHGIASMLATGYLDFDEKTISDLISDDYTGLCLRHMKGGKENEGD